MQERVGCGLETDVLAPDPVSFKLPENVVIPEPEEPRVVQGHKTRKRRSLSSAKIIAVSSFTFHYFRIRENPVSHALGLCKYGIPPEDEEMTPGMDGESKLPLPGLLKGWTRETRERRNGSRDKFYYHPMCKKNFRSVVEIVNFIKSSNNLRDAEKHEKSEELQGPQSSGASSSKNKKGKNNGLQNQSKSRMKKSSQNASTKDTIEQIELEEFYADAYNNLMNLSP